jgi:hypothetical protein
MRLVEVLILSGSLTFGLFACLDFSPCRLFVYLSLPFLGAFFLWSFAGFHHSKVEDILCLKQNGRISNIWS